MAQPVTFKTNTTQLIIVLVFLLVMAAVVVYYNIRIKQIDQAIEITRKSASTPNK